ncbi:MAG: hypothetical protein P8Q14_07220 [Vicingaceae bacterium]|nr:hypothetical protein [Vicingaceae bacterium]
MFTLLWGLFILLLFDVLSKSLNLIYSVLVCVLLLPAFLFQGVINNQVFSLFFILIIFVSAFQKNYWSRKTKIILTIISGCFWLLLSNTPIFPFTKEVLFFNIIKSVLNNNILVWLHVLILIISITLTLNLDFDKTNKWRAFLLFFSIIVYSLFFTNSTILFATTIVIPILFIKQSVLSSLNKRIIITSLYISAPLALSSLYSISYNNSNWTFGLNESAQKAFDFTNKVKFSGNVFNNKEAEIEADLFFKNASTFFKGNRVKQVQLFNDIIYNSDRWHQYASKHNINIIYFSLVNQPQEALLFLGAQLNSGNWAIIYEEKNRRVLLIKRTLENQQVLNRFEQLPNPID